MTIAVQYSVETRKFNATYNVIRQYSTILSQHFWIMPKAIIILILSPERTTLTTKRSSDVI